MKQKLGLYAGSFSPFHVGHLDIVKQATNVFDKVLVAKGINPSKCENDKYILPYKYFQEFDSKVSAQIFECLLTDLIKAWERVFDVTLVRGLRNGADLEYEQNMMAFLKDMHPTIKAVAFYCDPRYRHVSSSALRGIEKIAPEEFKKYAILG